MRMQRLGQVVALLFWMLACDWPGRCKSDDDCQQYKVGTFCYGLEKRTYGVCTEGNLEAALEEKPAAKITEWRLVLSAAGEEIAPLRWDKKDLAEGLPLENAEAGWTGPTEALVEVELEATGPAPSESPKVWTNHQEAKCSPPPEAATDGEETDGKETSRKELWTCTFKSGWNSPKEAQETTETVEVHIKLGEDGETRSRTYRVDVQPPLVGLVVSAGVKCKVGDTCPEGHCKGIGGSTQAGAPGFCAGPSGVPVRVCAHARDTQSGLRSQGLQPNTPFASMGFFATELKADWKYDEENKTTTPFSECWSGILPINPTHIELVYFGMEVKAWDLAGNQFDSHIHSSYGTIHGSFERSSCIGLMEGGFSPNAVKAPLAYSKGQKELLLFGTSLGEGATAENNSLYFFDAEACALNSSLHTGALQGPLVVMGESGKAALALGGGGPAGRPGPRLAVADAYTQSFAERECIPGTGEIRDSAVFDKGLSLASAGNEDGTDGAGNKVWRFAAPANSAEENASRLVAYAPNVPWQGGHCMAECADHEHLQLAKGRFVLPPAYYLYQQGENEFLYEMAGIKEKTKKGEGLVVNSWKSNNNYWHAELSPLPFDVTHFPEYNSPNLSGMAVGRKDSTHEHLWLSGDGLWNICPGADADQILTAIWRTSPAALDDKGRAYVVVATGSGTEHEIQRFSTECRIDTQQCPSTEGEKCVGYYGQTGHSAPGICQRKSSSFNERPVGSPILGEPPINGRVNKLYVVSTTGTVLALNMETLTPLWLQSLGFRISPTAQPVLVPNPHGGGTLWVVGAQGEIRGIRVASEGLSKSADWPKAFHDNCNTSSSAVKSADMPSCF